MEHRIVVNLAPDLADRAAILAPLAAFNAQNAAPVASQFLAVLIQDADGATVGGLWGRTAYRWLFIELLVVPEAMRGQSRGASIMAAAEQIARDRGCIGAWVDTFSFQALGFYQKLGYEIFGEIEDYPPGEARYFLKKRLDDPAATPPA
jgi:GNAT superfamily N-acetyltransferase